MPASHCRKRSLILSKIHHPRQDDGVFFFGPGGQASIVPAQEPTLPSQPASGVQALPYDGQPSTVLTQSGQPTISQMVASTILEPMQTVLQAPIPSFMTSSAPSIVPLTVTSFATSTVPHTVSTASTVPSNTSSSGSTNSLLSQSASSPLSVATGFASPSDSSDLSGRGVPFYVGIVLGTIVVISSLATFIAWWIRLHSRSKRRRAFVDMYVPWGKPKDDDELEEARDTSFIGQSSLSIDRFIRGDGAFQSWSPIGDRDVGEPRRSSSFLHSPISPVKRSFVPPFAQNPYHPGMAYTNNAHILQLADSVAYPLPPTHLSHTPVRPLANHQDSSDSGIQTSAESLGPLQVTNMMPGDVPPKSPGTVLGTATFGTPRELVAGSRPRFLGLEGNGLTVPWTTSELNSTAQADNAKQGAISYRCQSPERAGSMKRKTSAEENWTASLRQNLVNAVNLVTGNLTASHQTEDHLTPAPRRTSQRRSAHHAGWGEHVGGHLVKGPLKREITSCSTSSWLSKAWTLEETGDGSGIVHFRSLEGYGGLDYARSCSISSHSNSEDGSDCKLNQSCTTFTSHTPLVITKKPKAAVLNSVHRKQLYGCSQGVVSRASSVYSTASATSSMCSKEISGAYAPRLASIASFTSRNVARSRKGRSERTRSSKRAYMRPKAMSRGSSSGYSMASQTSGVSRLRNVVEDAEVGRE